MMNVYIQNQGPTKHPFIIGKHVGYYHRKYYIQIRFFFVDIRIFNTSA